MIWYMVFIKFDANEIVSHLLVDDFLKSVVEVIQKLATPLKLLSDPVSVLGQYPIESVGVTGTVRNLPDGSVEAVAEGTPQALANFQRELERGPSFGRVTAVEVTELPHTGRYRGFGVEY